MSEIDARALLEAPPYAFVGDDRRAVEFDDPGGHRHRDQPGPRRTAAEGLRRHHRRVHRARSRSPSRRSIGQTEGRARNRLTEDGLDRARHVPGRDRGQPRRRRRRRPEPAGGSLADPGTEITITVARSVQVQTTLPPTTPPTTPHRPRSHRPPQPPTTAPPTTAPAPRPRVGPDQPTFSGSCRRDRRSARWRQSGLRRCGRGSCAAGGGRAPVRMLSGWNCTPSTSWSRWRTPITTPSARAGGDDQAVGDRRRVDRQGVVAGGGDR